MGVVSMYTHEGVRTNLPRALIDYSEGVLQELPKGSWSPRHLSIARSLRRTFFRRLQRDRPGFGWQWSDYHIVMHEEIIKYAKRALTKPLLERWQEICQRIPKLYAIFENLLHQRFRIPRYLLIEDQLPKAAVLRLMKEAVRQAAHDPTVLGQMEELVFGKPFYGYPTGSYKKYE